MTGPHDAAEYGRFIAADYDALYEGVFDTEGAVARLAGLAAGGPVLELGVGTGRLAIPLAERGLAVHGVDGSPEMLALLAAKPGGEAVSTTVGDFAELDVPGTFALAAITFNTIFALPDQASQVRCFASTARHLRPGGRFVVEAWVPDAAVGPDSQLSTRKLAGGYVGLVVAEHDRASQVLRTTQVVLGGAAGVRVYPVVHRYAHPAELDLMAQLAGMRLEHRWADWHGSAYVSTSPQHVSVYRLG
ncbi:MAG: methyltransferase domain-containing protein [Acidimicrobiia bacterium]|nr:methyltransferase domain-containing protein [Acidimicrobiia bacterium]